MDKYRKFYIKAMNYYNDGYIEEALEYCEKSLALCKNNCANLNLIGLLYYLKGNLQLATEQWKTNYKINNDEIAKKYLEDSYKDASNIEKFKKAQNLLQSMKIQEALKILIELSNSDFNYINLNNNIASCYIKLGQYEKAKEYIDKVLKVDKKNKQCERNKKILIDIGYLKKERKYSNKIIALIIIILIFSGILKVAPYIKNKVITHINNKNKTIVTKEKEIDSNKLNNKVEANKNNEVNKSNKVNAIKFPFNELNNFIKKKDYDSIINILNKFNVKNLNDNEKQMYIKGVDLIKEEGIEFYYNKAKEFRENNQYKNSIICLEKVYKFSDTNYLNEHIIYMLGVSYEHENDITNAIKYYEVYAEKYKADSYTESVLYNLAILNKNININLAKKYGNILVQEYPNSQFNNSKIEEILSN